MTVNRQIIAAPIEDVAPTLDRGLNVLRLDADHCEVWCSDHGVIDAADQATQSDLDAFVSDLPTVADHAESPATLGEITVPEDHPLADTSPYPDQAKFDGVQYPTVAVENGTVVFDRG